MALEFRDVFIVSSMLPQKGMVMKLMMRAQMSQPLPSPDLNISDGADDDRRLPCPIRFVNNYYMNLAYIIATMFQVPGILIIFKSIKGLKAF